MANPQAEDGHIDIANEIMEALSRTRIPGEARQILDCILRKTYGWHKKQDSISLSQFQHATGLERNQVCRSIKKLVVMNLIIKGSDKDVTKGSDKSVPTITTYEFQKDFDKWVGSDNTVTGDKDVTKGSDKTHKEVVTKLSHTKENIQKKTNKRKASLLADDEFWKEVRKIYTWVDIDVEIQRMKGYQLTSKGRNWKPTQKRVIFWLNRIDKPVDVDKKGEDPYSNFEIAKGQ